LDGAPSLDSRPSLRACTRAYCTEKLVVELDCRSPETTVVVTSYLPVRAFAGRVIGKAELYVPVWRAPSTAGFATSSPFESYRRRAAEHTRKAARSKRTS
jgi:hypothetical protein